MSTTGDAPSPDLWAGILAALEEVEEETRRELCAGLAALVPPGTPKAIRVKLGDPNWWAALDRELRQIEIALDFNDLGPEAQNELRGMAVRGAAVALARVLSEQRAARQAGAAAVNDSRRKEAADRDQRIRVEFAKLSPTLSVSARCQLLRKQFGWKPSTVRAAVQKAKSKQ